MERTCKTCRYHGGTYFQFKRYVVAGYLTVAECRSKDRVAEYTTDDKTCEYWTCERTGE